MNKKYKDIDLNKPASFKQQWAMAYKYSESLIGDYPDLSEKQLAKLLKGTIYHYHQNTETELTHGDVQNCLNGLRIPFYYVEELDNYLLKNNDKDIKHKQLKLRVRKSYDRKLTAYETKKKQKKKKMKLEGEKMKVQKWEWEK